MKLGLQINNFTWPGEPESIREILAQAASNADEVGFATIWVMDHFFQIGYHGSAEQPMLEAYTTLGYIAGKTKNARLGTMVTGVIYRQPALLIKAVTTLDVLSGGRAILGIGAAWNEEECIALGFDFPPVKERFERLEETLKLAKQMWSGDEKPFKGQYVNAQNPMLHPSAISKPHPPILIGGGGEQKTLKFVAQYADMCNLFNGPELEHKLDVLKEHCRNIGRNYNEIEKTVMIRMSSESDQIDTDRFIKQCQSLSKLGVGQVR